MKKYEAQMIAPEKSKVMVGFLEEILNSDEKIRGKMILESNGAMLTANVSVPKSNIEQCWDLEISSEHAAIFYETFLNNLLDTFLNHETMGVSKSFSIYDHPFYNNFLGVVAMNSLGSEIAINFKCQRTELNNLLVNYNQVITNYEKSMTERKIK